MRFLAPTVENIELSAYAVRVERDDHGAGGTSLLLLPEDLETIFSNRLRFLKDIVVNVIDRRDAEIEGKNGHHICYAVQYSLNMASLEFQLEFGSL
jgi:hypothetical protein